MKTRHVQPKKTVYGRSFLSRFRSVLTENSAKLLKKTTDRLPGFVFSCEVTNNSIGKFLFISSRVFQLYGISPCELKANSALFTDIIHRDDVSDFLSSYEASLGQDQAWLYEYRVCTNLGIKWMLINAKLDLSDTHILYGFITDVTERKSLENRIHKLAFYDQLTELPNRYLLYERLEQAIASNRRLNFHSSILFIDLDNFKPINDVYGHLAGDALLVEAAKRLKSCVREVDTVSRYGGDEFVILLSELSDDFDDANSQSKVVAEKILASLNKIYTLHTATSIVEHECTASIGVVTFCNCPAVDTVIQQADSAMYEAKYSGRNSICFFSEE